MQQGIFNTYFPKDSKIFDIPVMGHWLGEEVTFDILVMGHWWDKK